MAKMKGNIYEFQSLYTKDHKFIKQLNTMEQLYNFSKVEQLHFWMINLFYKLLKILLQFYFLKIWQKQNEYRDTVK